MLTSTTEMLAIGKLCLPLQKGQTLQETARTVAAAITIEITVVILFFVPSLMTFARELNWWPTKMKRATSALHPIELKVDSKSLRRLLWTRRLVSEP
jgi:uncharacterized membrane protein YdfJ with MMPL/SSD domain